jgi:hypothetical protein
MTVDQRGVQVFYYVSRGITLMPQNLQRLAFREISLRHSGHSRVSFSGKPLRRLDMAVSLLIG